jgi:TetR/AcrR family transcriptional regulator, transcriptional repressor for nem operon
MTLAPTTTDRGTETRRRILEVAAEAFSDRGYAGTSLSDVLKASGVTKGGFYFHFPSKSLVSLVGGPFRAEDGAGCPLTS